MFELNKDANNLQGRSVSYSAGELVIAEGTTTENIYMIESGWAIEYRLLNDGRRQIVNFILPGDCFGLQSLSKKIASYSVCVVVDTRLKKITTEDFKTALKMTPKLAESLLQANMQELSIIREHVVRIGRMSAIERIAHMLLEINIRLSEFKNVEDGYVGIKIPQALITDALGLSVVHVSRTLTKLQNLGHVRLSEKGIHIIDPEKMSRMCGFERAYLDHLDTKRVA